MDNSSRTVILYGKSMLLSLVASNLSNSTALQVIEACSWKEVKALTLVHPAVTLIYDLTIVNESRILPLLFGNPNLLIIGLDIETNRAVQLMGQETRSLTLDGMKELILAH